MGLAGRGKSCFTGSRRWMQERIMAKGAMKPGKEARKPKKDAKKPAPAPVFKAAPVQATRQKDK